MKVFVPLQQFGAMAILANKYKTVKWFDMLYQILKKRIKRENVKDSTSQKYLT